MTAPDPRSWSCARKVRFTTERAARRRVREAREAGKDPDGTFGVYGCVHCGGFHTGNSRQRGTSP